MEQIRGIIEEKIRPILKAHDGDIELIEVTSDGVVKVRLSGACATCSAAQQTLSDVVEAELRASCPEVKGVILSQQVSEDLIAEALKILRKHKN